MIQGTGIGKALASHDGAILLEEDHAYCSGFDIGRFDGGIHGLRAAECGDSGA
jgi:hypothetical protein